MATEDEKLLLNLTEQNDKSCIIFYQNQTYRLLVKKNFLDHIIKFSPKKT